ncbi:hypothetical protein IC235_17435 [Hymenobacter sp. BT664]|uniref:Uncharacterized protein n=1 Tax=Hymenobacter montanus TaxID=2771359 RepID=A0A927GL04_9BACT|nr:hypothetical protein [Hymenobacter montanus]MBD2769676.1 hypothetical protein [Hymenobacter montanus]
MATNTPTPGLNQQQENALQEVVKVIDEAVASGRIAPTVRTVFNQLMTQTRAINAGVPQPGSISAAAAMVEISARTVAQ